MEKAYLDHAAVTVADIEWTLLSLRMCWVCP